MNGGRAPRMDSGTVFLTILIAFWALLEYRRRERNHKELLKAIKGGRAPSSPGAPTGWMILGEALVALLLVATALLTIRAGWGDRAHPWLLIGMGVLFAAMALIVLLMLGRDIHHHGSTPPVSEGNP